MKKILFFLLCLLLIFEQSGFAQVAGQLDISAHILSLRNSFIQDKFRPLHLRYLSYDPLNNNFRLLLDKGDFEKEGTVPSDLSRRGHLSVPYGSPKETVPEEKLEEATKELLNYFFIGISLPNDSFWVNLRPDSPHDIIDPFLAQTDIGKILLEADVQLKKDTALATSPETPEGKRYWEKLYKRVEELFGYENITIPTLTRPWIVPDEIIIREAQDNAYIYKATLKVMLEEDYLKDSSGRLNVRYNFDDPRLKALNEYSSLLLRELIIPKLTKEVNTSKRYAPLRQVYYSLILAQWFKQKFKVTASVNTRRGGLNLPYTLDKGTVSELIDSRNLANLTSKEPWSKTTYFKEYQRSFQTGEYNLKEPIYTPYGQTIRSYMSGGVALNALNGMFLSTKRQLWNLASYLLEAVTQGGLPAGLSIEFVGKEPYGDGKGRAGGNEDQSMIVKVEGMRENFYVVADPLFDLLDTEKTGKTTGVVFPHFKNPDYGDSNNNLEKQLKWAAMLTRWLPGSLKLLRLVLGGDTVFLRASKILEAHDMQLYDVLWEENIHLANYRLPQSVKGKVRNRILASEHPEVKRMKRMVDVQGYKKFLTKEDSADEILARLLMLPDDETVDIYIPRDIKAVIDQIFPEKYLAGILKNIEKKTRPTEKEIIAVRQSAEKIRTQVEALSYKSIISEWIKGHNLPTKDKKAIRGVITKANKKLGTFESGNVSKRGTSRDGTNGMSPSGLSRETSTSSSGEIDRMIIDTRSFLRLLSGWERTMIFRMLARLSETHSSKPPLVETSVFWSESLIKNFTFDELIEALREWYKYDMPHRMFDISDPVARAVASHFEGALYNALFLVLYDKESVRSRAKELVQNQSENKNVRDDINLILTSTSKPKDIAGLINTLSHPETFNPFNRELAAQRLGELRHKGAIPSLIEAIVRDLKQAGYLRVVGQASLNALMRIDPHHIITIEGKPTTVGEFAISFLTNPKYCAIGINALLANLGYPPSIPALKSFIDRQSKSKASKASIDIGYILKMIKNWEQLKSKPPPKTVGLNLKSEGGFARIGKGEDAEAGAGESKETILNSNNETFDDIWNRMKKENLVADVSDPMTWSIDPEEESIAQEYARMNLQELQDVLEYFIKDKIVESSEQMLKNISSVSSKYPLLTIFIDNLSSSYLEINHHFKRPIGNIKIVKSAINSMRQESTLTTKIEGHYKEYLVREYKYKAYLRELTRRWTKPSASSSPLTSSDPKGGIDFTALPIGIQPMQSPLGSVPANAGRGGLNLPYILDRGTVPMVNFDEAWQEIEHLLNAKIIPSIERFRQILLVSCENGLLEEERDKVLSCLAGILRIEEEHCSLTEDEFKQLLILLESDKSPQEFILALGNITAQPKEPK